MDFFLYYKALLRWAHSSKWARKWWSARCDHTWWSVRRDHTWWSARHFLPHLPYKIPSLLSFHLHYEIVEVIYTQLSLIVEVLYTD